MTRDNCLIYACQKGGVDESIIDHMREIIKVRSFPQSKLQTISEECGIKFEVSIIDLNNNSNNSKITYTPSNVSDPQLIKLLLCEGHYMLNDPVECTTYYIEHYEDIMKCTPGWTDERRQKIYRIDQGKYKIKSSELYSSTIDSFQ